MIAPERSPCGTMSVILHLVKEPLGLERFKDGLSSGFPAQAAEGFRGAVVDTGVLGENIEQGQIMALAHGVVVEVVGRGDFHAARPEGRVDVVVGDNRQGPAREGEGYPGPNEVLVSRVLRVHGYRRVSQKRLRSGGGHH